MPQNGKPPSHLAKLSWEQAKTAVASDASTWQEHPNAQRARPAVKRSHFPMIMPNTCPDGAVR